MINRHMVATALRILSCMDNKKFPSELRTARHGEAKRYNLELMVSPAGLRQLADEIENGGQFDD